MDWPLDTVFYAMLSLKSSSCPKATEINAQQFHLQSPPYKATTGCWHLPVVINKRTWGKCRPSTPRNLAKFFPSLSAKLMQHQTNSSVAFETIFSSNNHNNAIKNLLKDGASQGLTIIILFPS